MNQQPDEIFRRSLENYKKPAPETAWSRIEENLDKTQRFSWLKIAATLLLCTTVAGMTGLYLMNDQPSTEIATKQNGPAPSSPSNDPGPSNTASGEANGDDQRDMVSDATPTKKSDPKTAKPKPVTASEKTNVSEPMPSLTHQVQNLFDYDSLREEKNIGNAIEDGIERAVANELAIDDPESSDYKLVVQASEVNSKYLIKKEFAQATDTVKKSSGIKKLLDKAQDLKTNQDALADLRQMKNEILAFNFQKQDQNNK